LISLTVGVFLWVFDKTMSRKSAAVGTGAIAFRPLVDMAGSELGRMYSEGKVEERMPHFAADYYLIGYGRDIRA
jgi:hypothetical protein